MSKGSSKFAVALVIYTCLAVYLYCPYFSSFGTPQYLLVANASLAALGCFVLSRRWVLSFWGSFFAGALYGFGPLLLGFGKYHPTAGLLTATLPWLFCPAAFAPKLKRRWLQLPLSVLPFLAIPLFFEAFAYLRFFPISIRTRLHLTDLAGTVVPLIAAEHNMTLAGFYHIPIAALVIGASMMIAARRFGIMAVFAIGLILSFCPAVLNTSPIIWLSFPTLCCCVLAGQGTQGLISAGASDRKWILASAIVLAALSLGTALLTTRPLQIWPPAGQNQMILLAQTSRLYLVGAIGLLVVYFIAGAKLRLTAVRVALLCPAMAIDIFFGARFIVDKIL